MTDPIWITCRGPRRDGRDGFCDKKLARLLIDGRFEIKNVNLTMYVCSGVVRIDCPSCREPCLLICLEK